MIHLLNVIGHQVSVIQIDDILKLNECIIATPRPIEVIQPCNPSPCGINAECTERGQAASCRCILDYIGNPYIECKPECTVNSECPNDKSCINNKCKDPCPGVCGVHATCHVTNHAPQCTCDPGYAGNAFVACRRVTSRKFVLHRSYVLENMNALNVLSNFFSTPSYRKNRSLQPFTMWK